MNMKVLRKILSLQLTIITCVSLKFSFLRNVRSGTQIAQNPPPFGIFYRSFDNEQKNDALSMKPTFGRRSLLSMTPFSLDRSVLPRKIQITQIAFSVCVVASVLTAIVSAFGSGLVESGIRTIFQRINSILNFFRADFAPFIKLGSRILLAKTAVVAETVQETLRRIFDINPIEEINLRDWTACMLEDREILPGGYMKCRFELKNPSAVLPLYMGQEIILCAIDSSDRALKEPYFPITTSSTRGYFEIITRRYTSNKTVILDKVAKLLETLPLGEELAFKTGKYRLDYQGKDDPIRKVSLLVSGLGITPALQMLRGVLPGKDSTVEEVEVLWVNEEKADFICNKEMEMLEYRYIEKLYVARTLQSDLYGMDIAKNAKVREELTPYEEGRIAVVCGPDYVVSKARSLFVDLLGYPTDNVMGIVTPS